MTNIDFSELDDVACTVSVYGWGIRVKPEQISKCFEVESADYDPDWEEEVDNRLYSDNIIILRRYGNSFSNKPLQYVLIGVTNFRSSHVAVSYLKALGFYQQVELINETYTF